MRACSFALLMFFAIPLGLVAQVRPDVADREGYHEFRVYYTGVEESAVTRVAVAPVAFERGGQTETKIRDFYWYPVTRQVLAFGLPARALEGQEQVTFSLRGLCGSHSIIYRGTWETSLMVDGVPGECKVKNIPGHTLPKPVGECYVSSSWVVGDPGYNDQRDAAVESLLAQIGIPDAVIEALCSAPCPKPKKCLASNITSADGTDDVDKSEQDDPEAPGERQWKIKILKASENGWDGQVYCACLTTTNQS